MTFNNSLFLLLLLFGCGLASAEQEIERIQIEHTQPALSLNKQLLDREVIEASAATLTDLIASLLSVQIRKLGGLGDPVAISIRGSTNQQVNLRIDGQLLNSGQSGGFDLDLIPVSLIESIEVSQFQSDATGPTPIGGEIRINTLKPDGDSRSAALTLGSFGLAEINVKQDITVASHQLTASVNHIQSDNDYRYSVPQSFDNSQVSANEPLRNNQFRKTTVFVSDAFGPEQAQTRVNGQFNSQKKAQPNYQNNSPEQASSLENRNFRLGVEQSWLRPFSQSSPAIHFDGHWFEQEETFLDRPFENQHDEYRYKSQQAYIHFRAPWSSTTSGKMNWQITPYLNLNHQTFDSASAVNGNRPICNGIQTCDVTAEQQLVNLGTRVNWQLAPESVSVHFLYNHLVARNENSLKYTAQPERISDHFDYDSAELNFQYRLEDHNLSLHLAKGIRIPTMAELFGDRGSFKGNERLEAEQSQAVTLNSHAFWPIFSIQNSLYYQEIDNTIVAIFNARGIGRFENVAESKTWGLATSARFQVTSKLTLSGHFDWLDTKTSSPFVAFDNKHLPGIYHNQLQLKLDYDLSAEWQFSFAYKQDGDLYFDRANKISSRSHFNTDRETTDIAIIWQKHGYMAKLNIQNLLDHTYYDLANRPAEGRNIQLKFIIKEF